MKTLEVKTGKFDLEQALEMVENYFKNEHIPLMAHQMALEISIENKSESQASFYLLGGNLHLESGLAIDGKFLSLEGHALSAKVINNLISEVSIASLHHFFETEGNVMNISEIDFTTESKNGIEQFIHPITFAMTTMGAEVNPFTISPIDEGVERAVLQPPTSKVYKIGQFQKKDKSEKLISSKMFWGQMFYNPYRVLTKGLSVRYSIIPKSTVIIKLIFH